MPDNDSPLYRVLAALPGDQSPRKSGAGYVARCPAHDDQHASLSIGTGLDGRVLLRCFVGCSADAIVAALGLQLYDLFEKSPQGNPIRRFKLVAPNGEHIATHVREDVPGDKKIWWEHDGKRGLNGTPLESLPLYRLPDVLAADPSRPVIVCEGEKAADALTDIGLLAVGTVTGAASTPCEASLAALSPHEVWLWPDHDEPGQQHMQRIAQRLHDHVRWLAWPTTLKGGDAADYVSQGGTAAGVADLLVMPIAVPQRGPRLDIIRMADVQPEPIEWLWRGRYARGKPTLLMGDPGLGKSLITHWSAAKISRGGEWPDGGECEQSTAILFTIEDGLADTVAPRLLAANADMHRVIAVRGVLGEDDSITERMFALTEHLSMLERLIIETKANFVVMDPVTAYLGPDVNSHQEAEVRGVLGPLQLLAERTRIAMLMLMHLNKGTGVSALYRATGSIAFPAVARVVLGVAPDPNDDEGKRRLLLPIKMNIGKLPEGIGYRIETYTDGAVLPRVAAEDQPPVLKWDLEPVTIDATSAMDRNGSVQELGAVAEAKQVLEQILAHGRVPANECKRQIRESSGITSETSLSRARKELGIRVRREGFGTGGVWYWELATNVSTIDLARARAYSNPHSLEPLQSMESLDGFKDSIDSTVSDLENTDSENKGSKGSKGSKDLDLARARSLCRVCGGELQPGLERIGLHYDCVEEARR